jgi:hypothetical protein
MRILFDVRYPLAFLHNGAEYGKVGSAFVGLVKSLGSRDIYYGQNDPVHRVAKVFR